MFLFNIFDYTAENKDLKKNLMGLWKPKASYSA